MVHAVCLPSGVQRRNLPETAESAEETQRYAEFRTSPAKRAELDRPFLIARCARGSHRLSAPFASPLRTLRFLGDVAAAAGLQDGGLGDLAVFLGQEVGTGEGL